MALCAKCGAHYDDKYDGCPLCANSAPVQPAATVFLPDLSALLGYAGALLLLAGTLLPALKISAIIINADYSLLGGGPLMEQMNAAMDSPMHGFLALGSLLALFAVGTAVFVLAKMWPGLWISGGLALAVTGYGYFSLTGRIAAAAKAAGADGAALASAIKPGIGWAALMVGALCVLGAAVASVLRPR